MIDGSMVFTDDGWQEVKLGRVFPMDGPSSEWRVDSSEYVAMRGHYSRFTQGFERLLPPDSSCGKVFVTDGALWIGNWLSEAYPDAVQILDFYHLSEHLGKAAEHMASGSAWMEWAKDAYRHGNGHAVEASIAASDQVPQKVRDPLLSYLSNNRYRTNYPSYIESNYMIGSGPIEAAHRTVLQKRMKRSGQRWSNLGGDRLVKLRAIVSSEKEHLIRQILVRKAG
jgi:hypothetical protein